MRISFFRCECGKLHIADGLTSTSVCTCGKHLLTQLANHPTTTLPPTTKDVK